MPLASRLLSILLILTALLPRTAQAYGCAAAPEPQVVVVPLVSKPRMDDTENLARIRELSGKAETRYAGFHEVPVGLTASSMKLTSSFTVNSQRTSDDPMVCAWVPRLELQFGFEDTTIYLARELPRHSCGYETVLEHELRHVAIDQQILATYRIQLPSLLAGALRQMGVVRASSSPMAEAQFRAALNGWLQQLAATITAERERQQQAIDTVEEYQRISQSCGGEIAKLVRETQGGR